jgi:hypothetical protein
VIDLIVALVTVTALFVFVVLSLAFDRPRRGREN